MSNKVAFARACIAGAAIQGLGATLAVLFGSSIPVATYYWLASYVPAIWTFERIPPQHSRLLASIEVFTLQSLFLGTIIFVVFKFKNRIVGLFRRLTRLLGKIQR